MDFPYHDHPVHHVDGSEGGRVVDTLQVSRDVIGDNLVSTARFQIGDAHRLDIVFGQRPQLSVNIDFEGNTAIPISFLRGKQ